MAETAPDWSRLRRLFSARGKGAQTSREAVRPENPALAWELAEERAAIMEYDGGLSRAEAERLAFRRGG